jgi:transposase, IS5 family
MYQKSTQSDLSPEKFELPFSGKLSPNNRWVIMAELIPWTEFESEYVDV